MARVGERLVAAIGPAWFYTVLTHPRGLQSSVKPDEWEEVYQSLWLEENTPDGTIVMGNLVDWADRLSELDVEPVNPAQIPAGWQAQFSQGYRDTFLPAYVAHYSPFVSGATAAAAAASHGQMRADVFDVEASREEMELYVEKTQRVWWPWILGGVVVVGTGGTIILIGGWWWWSKKKKRGG